ncbi:hypothetical protein COU75_01320 [Candidatus Peregrinibacteria bacterium CG10_big_fil_rev_8_21_14_0_10_42_8]|nr:MAG: hypothetical protein COU75_01320 [Candidatus Peregrinibacteria bacterium CG10_big_fil_rev_8_21_14_0_10_42_8]
MSSSLDTDIDLSDSIIGLDGPPYVELQNIEVASWDVRNQLIKQLEDAVVRGDLQRQSVFSSRERVLGVQKKLEERMLAILQAEDKKEFAVRWIIGEVCVNSGISHGNEADPSKIFETMHGIDTQSNAAIVYIGDQGSGFNPLEVPDPTASFDRIEKSSGRGLHTMDELQLRKLGEGAQGIYLPMYEGSAMCREFVLKIPLDRAEV